MMRRRDGRKYCRPGLILLVCAGAVMLVCVGAVMLVCVGTAMLDGRGREHSCSWELTDTVQPDCVNEGSAVYICTECGAEREEVIPALGHDLITEWYGEEPTCQHGGYRMVYCQTCGWVDETACASVEPLEHIPQMEELQHGNCREDTIIVYVCSECGEQTGYERHQESDEHNWVWKDTLVWDEASLAYIVTSVECCERCNLRR